MPFLAPTLRHLFHCLSRRLFSSYLNSKQLFMKYQDLFIVYLLPGQDVGAVHDGHGLLVGLHPDAGVVPHQEPVPVVPPILESKTGLGCYWVTTLGHKGIVGVNVAAWGLGRA